MTIRMISFDLWGTLIKPNPEYKTARIKIISEYTKEHPDEITHIFSRIKKDFDKLVEEYSASFNPTTLYRGVLSQLGIHSQHIVREIEVRLQNKFIAHPPLLYGGTITNLEQIDLKIDTTLISNTLLTRGEALMAALPDLMIHFENKIFSDAYQVSKPLLFSDHCYSFHRFQPREILHVGDNVITDGGCQKYGFNFFQINSNDKTIADIHEHILTL